VEGEGGGGWSRQRRISSSTRTFGMGSLLKNTYLPLSFFLSSQRATTFQAWNALFAVAFGPSASRRSDHATFIFQESADGLYHTYL
jgi:hypothetical protein